MRKNLKAISAMALVALLVFLISCGSGSDEVSEHGKSFLSVCWNF